MGAQIIGNATEPSLQIVESTLKEKSFCDFCSRNGLKIVGFGILSAATSASTATLPVQASIATIFCLSGFQFASLFVKS